MDLLIRTSGERRVSNFFLWEIAYAELYFTETMWPDFAREDLFAALRDYAGRERRFGKTSAQMEAESLDAVAPEAAASVESPPPALEGPATHAHE